MERILKGAATALLCVAAFSCAGPSDDASSDGLVCFNADSLRSGDLICRLGDGFFSDIFRRYSGGEERFSHIGILHREGDSCFVIHAEASELTGIGWVKRDPLSLFVDESLDWQVFRVKADSLRLRVDSFALLYYQRPTPFDLDFDLSNDSALYCTELVAVCIERSLDEKGYVPAFPLRKEFSYYRVDDILRCGVVEMDSVFIEKKND